MIERREVSTVTALLLLLVLCLGGCATYSNEGQTPTAGSTTQEPMQQPMQADTTSMSEPAASPDTSSMPH